MPPSKNSRTEILPNTAKMNDGNPSVSYLVAPLNFSQENIFESPFWRVRFDLLSTGEPLFGLDIYDDVVLGRSSGQDDDSLIDLSQFDMETMSISRRHVMLRPTSSNLYLIDLGSTNGTMRNGRSIGVNTPYPLISGDVLSLGDVRLSVHIIDRPPFHTTPFNQDTNFSIALSQIAKAITSQLTLDEVLNQVAETAMTVTAASEAGIWPIDERTGELFLEAQRGIEDERIRRLRLPIHDNSLAGRVIQTGKPYWASREPGQEKIKLHTSYFAEAVAEIPIILGGVTFGVLSVARQTSNRNFTRRDIQLLVSIADFAAIAIQNARLYEATDQALARRVQELAALNEVTRAVSSSLDLDAVSEVLNRQIKRYIPVAGLQLYLVDPLNDGVYPYRDMLDIIPIPRRQTYKQGIIAKVAETGVIERVNDVASNPDYYAEIDAWQHEMPHSLLAVPLFIKSRVVGVLAYFNRKDGPFTVEDEDWLQAFASPIATAIENARLFAESERQRTAVQAMTAHLSQPILMIDVHGNILVSNEAAQKLLDSHMSPLFAAISGGVGRTTEVMIGESAYLATTEHLPDMGTILVMQDISYVKKLEKDRSDFIHTLSHDLKNPLTSIMGWTELLLRTISDEQKARKYAKEIVSVSQRMVVMVNELLKTLSGEESIQLNRQPSNLVAIIARAINDIRGGAMQKGITLSFDPPAQNSPIWADPLRMYHMVVNLIENAIKYSPEHTAVEIDLTFAEKEITLQVKDQGPGIPEEDLPRIFDKYFRSHQTSDKAGTGLGLAGVRSIVEAHGGSVQAFNREEGGSRFVVWLPGSLRLLDEKKQSEPLEKIA
ncbi:MAG: GAF domain-containing protein [Candidatus Promineifilaceae bacterium]